MYEYSARAVRVIDGDTMEVDVDLGFHVKVRQTLRLLGIDAPELRARDDQTRAAAVKSMSQLAVFTTGYQLRIKTTPDIRGNDRVDSLGRRYLAEVWAGGTMPSVNQQMIESGNAVAWVTK